MRTTFFALVIALLAPSASAGPPLPWECRFDTTLVLCPAGDVVFHGYLGRFGPYPNGAVILDFSSSPAVRILTALDGSYELYGSITLAISNHLGLVAMSLRGGGIHAAEIGVVADGMPICSRPVASFDQDGDLIVDGGDEAIAAAKLGTADRTADFDGDLLVTTADLALLQAHRGHAEEMPTATRAVAWGRIKALYR